MGKNIVFPGSVCGRLLRDGIISEDQLDEALEIQKTNRALVGSILVELGYCTEEDVAKALAEKTFTKFISINEIGVNMTAASLITPEMATRNNILPLFEEGGALYVAMKNPNDIITIDDLKRITGYDIKPLVATDSELAAAIENFVNASSNISNFSDSPWRDFSIANGFLVSELSVLSWMPNAIHTDMSVSRSSEYVVPMALTNV